MRFLCLMLLALALGCDGATAADAGPPDAGSADADPLRPRCPANTDYQGSWIVFPDGLCRACHWEPLDSDSSCEALDPPLGAGCRAYCNWGLCAEKCPDTCEPTSVPDAGSPPDAGPGCVPGTGMCPIATRPICDPSCGESGDGACRACVFDDDCAAEYGLGTICARHCGTCCNVDADAGIPCNCI